MTADRAFADRALPGRALPDKALALHVRAALAAAGDPERARAQQRYLKCDMPFHGVPLPQVRTLARPILQAHTPTDHHSWEETVRHLWDEATHREEWYVAIMACRLPAVRPWQNPPLLELYRHLIVTGAWWDVVDDTASHLVGGVLHRHWAEVTPLMRQWAVAGNLWQRRASVLCQLRHRGETDTELLRFTIEQNVEDSSFWLRKAIGWALRQHARIDPAWVRAEVERLDGRLSGLSRREALKHL